MKVKKKKKKLSSWNIHFKKQLSKPSQIPLSKVIKVKKKKKNTQWIHQKAQNSNAMQVFKKEKIEHKLKIYKSRTKRNCKTQQNEKNSTWLDLIYPINQSWQPF